MPEGTAAGFSRNHEQYLALLNEFLRLQTIFMPQRAHRLGALSVNLEGCSRSASMKRAKQHQSLAPLDANYQIAIATSHQRNKVADEVVNSSNRSRSSTALCIVTALAWFGVVSPKDSCASSPQSKEETPKQLERDRRFMARSVQTRLAELSAHKSESDQLDEQRESTKAEKADALLVLYEKKKRQNKNADAVAIAKQYVASGGDRIILAEALERVALWAEAAKQYSVLLRQLDSDDSSGASADLYYRFARCYTKLGQKALAGKYLRKSLASEQQFRAQALLFPESAEIDLFLTYDNPGRSSLSIPDNRYELEMALLSPEEIASLIIRQKYAPQDALLENIAERASAAEDPVGAAILSDLKRVKNAEAHHVLQCAIARQKTDECYRCTELRRKRQDMERCLTYGLLGGRSEDDSILLPSSRRESDYALAKLKKARPRRATVADLGKIRKGLPVGTAVVEFFSYQDTRAPRGCLRYAAAVICGDTNVQVVELPTVSEVDGYVSRFTSHSHEAARKLWELVWLPLDKHFDSVSRVIICPEGSLNLVPFAALCDKADRFVCEDKEIVYVVSSRDLLVANQFTSNRNLVAFGNPQASSADAGGAMVPGAVAPDLPGAEQEVELIRKIATDLGWQVEAKIGVAANESELRRLAKPAVLHCAMHALFPDVNVLGNRNLRGMKPVGTGNTDDEGTKEWIPADESGVLVFAGGENSARDWLAGKLGESTETDGVLTGKEAAELDLRGTWLTVLSACDTATIDVQGLRRGFMLAGSANLLMTLWPISDQDTAQIMETFYKRALLTGNAPLSLAHIQKEWLIKLRGERGVASAINVAGPFVMFSTGGPGLVIYPENPTGGLKRQLEHGGLRTQLLTFEEQALCFRERLLERHR